MKRHILEFLPNELNKYLIQINEKKYRTKQVLNWIYANKTLNFHNMSTLPESLREILTRDLDNYLPQILKVDISSDGTKKYLLSLADDKRIEMVLIPREEKNTLCISSQVGCAHGCNFCATASLGLIRNLKVYEILSQVFLAMMELKQKKLTNIVFMGMGEPLDNLENVIKSVKILQHEQCFKFSPRRITISTCGIIPKLKELTDSGLKIKLAVSLNSAIQEKREKIMPSCKKYPLPELKKALLNFRKGTPYRITFEYVLIKDFNMGKEDVKTLLKFLGDISCKLNVIVWNEVESLPYKAPTENEIENFINSMKKLSFAVTFRKSRGEDINAACGQLAAKV
ncbi:MAG: 23S rRNA (adenine(2503)-C(2))-methyltransferase RlmN [Candidatus Cloacimonetes bacterium]|nr:23S rRNA (adenine(2503)-C(2))-methyltransferase RlmN [Candidatus Cloacimonadota bacterium]